MSEPEQEPTEAPEQPQEAPEKAKEPDEEEVAEDEPAEQEEPEDAPEPDAPQGFSEKELEAGRKKLEREAERHANRVSEIMGEESTSLERCPLCSGFIDGWIFPVLPPDDVIAATRVAIGMPDLSNFQQAKNARMCDDCLGLGVVLSGSQVSGNVAIDCATCHASGYVIVQTGTGELVAPPTGNGAPPPTEFAGVNPDDPAVKELRGRGFTVIPPMQVQGAA